MKTLLTAFICSLALVAGALAQSPTLTPSVSPQAPSPAASASASASLSPAAAGSSLADRIHNKIDKKLKHKGVNFQIGGDEESADSGKSSGGDIPEAVFPIVGIVFVTLFGAPVLIVAVIMYFGFSKNRMMHKTVRLMVEKGQPVPEALLNPPPHVRKRSDMRRGVVLVMIGLGLMIFLAAVSRGEDGTWAIGVIPFLIGAGYLLVWKLEGKGNFESKADNPPPLP